MHLLSVRFRSEKPIQEIEVMSEASLPMFRKMPGLLEKYYVENPATGQVGGIYVWETLEQLRAYLDGPVIAAMPERFAMPEPPTHEILEVRGELRNDVPAAGEGRMIGSVRFTSGLPIEELETMSAASMGGYRDLPGLIRVFRVVEPGTGRVGGVYVWASETGLDDNLTGEGVARIPDLFKVQGAVDIERLRVSVALTD